MFILKDTFTGFHREEVFCGDDDDFHPSTAREILDENMNSDGDPLMASYREQNGSGLVDTVIKNRESEV